MKNAGISVLCCILALLLMLFAFLPKNNNKVKLNIKVLNTKTDAITEMNIEEYVLNVLRGEMPADFEIEALKAQAVAIRTYAIKKRGSNIDVHKGADVCDDYKHCMAYVDEKTAKANWKDNFGANNQKLKKAVYETEGKIMKYDGEPITAVFHAISSGKTENSNEVWNGEKLPYLSSVDSSVDTEVDGYMTEVEVPITEYEKKTGTSGDKLSYEYTEGGAVKKFITDDREFTGSEIRAMFGLRSASFAAEKKEGKFVFKVKGYGHGVGMSQRGANEYAKQGMKYDAILKKYYSGVTIE